MLTINPRKNNELTKWPYSRFIWIKNHSEKETLVKYTKLNKRMENEVLLNSNIKIGLILWWEQFFWYQENIHFSGYFFELDLENVFFRKVSDFNVLPEQKSETFPCLPSAIKPGQILIRRSNYSLFSFLQIRKKKKKLTWLVDLIYEKMIREKIVN